LIYRSIRFLHTPITRNHNKCQPWIFILTKKP
uniref:Uncharacterized protein n=1 Tax=Solanum lycopersicum TaxID=4081 RepID=A0A3Q7IDY0_SOLLC